MPFFRGVRGPVASSLLAALSLYGVGPGLAQDDPLLTQPPPLSPAPDSPTLPLTILPAPGQPPATTAAPGGPPTAPGSGPPAAPGAGSASGPSPGGPCGGAGGTPQAGGNPPAAPEDTPLWQRVPPVARLPRMGYFIVWPTGPGYYSLRDALEDNYREG